MSDLEQRLRLAATRLPGPYRSEADESGPAEVRSLVEQQPALADPVRDILDGFLERGSVDEARLSAYSADVVALSPDSLVAGYRRTDLPSFERSKLAFPLGRALLDPTLPLPPEIRNWVQDRNDGVAFWAAYFVRDRATFDRNLDHQLARDAAEAANQLWFAASLLDKAQYADFVSALQALAPTFGPAWAQHVVATLDAVRS